jgi:PKD repeat protein
MVAYDPMLNGGELVAYGASENGWAPYNLTWVHDASGWHDVTYNLSVSPPWIIGQEMDYDPVWGGVILAGATWSDCAPCGGSQTWLFNASGWHNLTALTIPLHGAPPVMFGGNMAWDGAIQRMVYVNGCVDDDCGNGELSQTWELGRVWSSLGNNSGPGQSTSLLLQGSAMAYDPTIGDLVLFGGYNRTVVNYPYPVTDVTYLFNGTAWVNDTSSLQVCEPTCAYPGARFDAAMSWDGQLGRIILVGGAGTTEDSYLADTSEFNGTGWARLAATTHCSDSEEALLLNATAVAPYLLGRAGCPDQVLEIPPVVASASVAPSPIDVGVPVQVGFVGQNDSGSGPLLEYSITTGSGAQVNGTVAEGAYPSPWAVRALLTYPVLGYYKVKVSVTDWYGLVANGSIGLRVEPSPAASFSVAPNVTELGVPVLVTAQAEFGTAPYAFAWSFGDGSTGTGATTAHIYLTAGLYSIQLETTDQGGGSARSTATVWIHPALALQILASSLVGEEGVPIHFTAFPSGGTGAYSAVSWSFGDGSSSAGMTVAHGFSSYGDFEVSATLTDSLGFATTANLTVAINVSVAVISAYVQSARPVAGEPVQFYLASGGGVGPIATSWVFGDGSIGSGPTPSHIYLAAGNYSVTVWANDTLGGSSKFAFPVQVSAKPTGRSPPSVGPPPGARTSVPVWEFAVVGALDAVVLAGVALYLQRRRRGGQTASPHTVPRSLR